MKIAEHFNVENIAVTLFDNWLTQGDKKTKASERATGGIYKKNRLKNFVNFTGKRQCQSLFFNKAAGQRSATLLKKRLWHSVLWHSVLL